MALHKQTSNGNIFLSVIQGKIRKTVDKDTPYAVKREYDDKEGNKKEKYEIVYDSIDGYITGMSFDDTEFGKVFKIVIDGATVSITTNSKYFTSIAKVIPNVDFSEPVMLRPYDFKPSDRDKNLVGISLKQDNEKVSNYFWDGKKAINGIPVPDANAKETYDLDDWKIYFTQEKKFLIKYIEGMTPTYNPFDNSGVEKTEIKDDTEITADDLPF